MAAPVWLTSAAVTPAGECVRDLALAFAGIVSLGVADSAASAVGRRYGRHRILGTRKTLEGTLGGITLTLAAWAVIWPLCRCGAAAAGRAGVLAQARPAQPERNLHGSVCEPGWAFV
jgi:dolichol kinase